MCAICGIIRNGKGVDPELLRTMARTMAYRGPDEEGYYIKENIGLGHRRLSIIDLNTGRQPLTNEDESLHLICNGEIYNFLQLRSHLEQKGHIFRTKSDNEVILHLYEDLGTKCLEKLRGMFAFALWNSREKSLFLARDRVGKKPLVYSIKDGEIFFASELKALLLVPEIKKEVDPESVDLFLAYQAIPSPRTIFREIKKLPPAHFLIWEQGRARLERYWDVDFSRKLRLKDKDEYAQALWDVLTEATRLRLISDVPLGAFLSGGIDSSTIVGIMSACSSRPVETFSVGFDEKDFSELSYAGLVARHFGTRHREFIVKPDVISILPKLVYHYNEPFGDSSMIPTYYVARETKRYVTVALNGDGGDENLAGYTRYWQTKLLERIDRTFASLPGASRLLSMCARGYAKYPQNTFFRVWRWLDETRRHGYGYAYARRLVAFSNEHKNLVYSPEFTRTLSGTDSFRFFSDIWPKDGNLNLLEKMLYSDFHLYLPEVLMVKMDIATMANSLEGRSPFLDHKFIELIASFPPDLKLRGGVTKYILKRKLKHFLPAEILKRRKMGFGVPVGIWFRNELKPMLVDTLLSQMALSRGYFNPAVVKRMVEEHISGVSDHSSRLWILLNLELWHRIFVDNKDYG